MGLARRSFEEQLLELIGDQIGYGRAMQIISSVWRKIDPLGAISMGECFGTLAKAKRDRKCVTCGRNEEVGP